MDHQRRGSGHVLRHQGERCRSRPRLAGSRRAVDRRGLHAGQPDGSPGGVHLAGRSVRSDANALYAARFLDTLRTGTGDWLAAAGAYHSQTAVLNADYRRRVAALWRDPASDWHLGLAVAYRDFARAALASYLLFEQAYTQSLIKLGYSDCMEKADDVRKFLGID